MPPDIPPDLAVSAAPRNTSATTDHRYAAMVPSETSVSMVVAPWRRFTRVARWKGQADHRMIGVESAKATHSHPENCSPGTIEIARTGTPSTTATTRRGVRSRSSSASGSSGSTSGTE